MTGARTFVVVGGGITGLCAARTLLVGDPAARVVLLEGSDRLGGKIASRQVGDVTIEAGPDLWLARDPAVTDLCRSLALGDDLVTPAVFGALVWSRGHLARLPRGFPYGLPASPWGAWRAGALSPWGALRAAAEILLPRMETAVDVTVGDFVRTRFGPETLERLVDPLLAGTRAGSADRLSLGAALPQIASVGASHRSILLGLRSERKQGAPGSGPPPFLTLRGGLETLTGALVASLGDRAEVRPLTSVERCRAIPGGGYQVVTRSGEPIACDGAVIAVPAFEAASIVRSLDDGAARELEAIGHASVAVATLVLPPESFTPPGETSGLLVSSAEDLTMSACTWYSAKWPTRAPSDGRVVLRCFVGRSRDDPAVELPDGELIGRLRADLRTTVGIVAEPLESAVIRWERGLPQYEVGHLDRVARVEQALAPHPGIALAGASLRGSGLTDCVRQANAAATRVLDGALLRRS